MESTVWFIIVFASLMIGFGIAYLYIKIKEHHKTCNRRICAFENTGANQTYLNLFTDLAKRTYVFYYSYALQNIVAILCDLFSLVFSIVAFIQIAEDQANIIISLLAITFVIITIYVKPQRRSSQYLKAWRRMEELTIYTLNEITRKFDLDSANVDEVNALFKNVNEQRAEIESSITADAE